MDIDFSLVLVILVLVTGFVYLLDLAFFKPRRGRAIAAYKGRVGEDKAEEGVVKELDAEPVWIEYPKSFFPVLLIVLLLRSFLVEPFTIPSGSMLPTLEVGDYVLVSKFAYGLRLPVIGTEVATIGKPQRGDIMVFKFPENPRINYIKRVVGLPGDKVRYDRKKLYINDELVPATLLARLPVGRPKLEILDEQLGKVNHEVQVYLAGNMRPNRSWTVGQDEYFVLGDNRDNSRDSRFWGFVPDKYIVGKAFAIWMHMPGWIPSLDRNRFLN